MSTPASPTPATFRQVDVFTASPYLGNALAVVQDGRGWSDEAMAGFARWTNLSETTFLLPPTPAAADAGADYRVRIFTPGGELPFAGHPTLGTAHAWLEAGGVPAAADGTVVQECGVGLVRVRRAGGRLAFAAPEPTTDAPLDEATLARVVAALGIDAADVVDHRAMDNGPGWLFVLLPSADVVLGLTPDDALLGDLKVGVVGPYPASDDPGAPAFEVRGFLPGDGIAEDPVTGSLNAVLGQWLVRGGRAPERYVASQGTVLGRRGRVHVERDAEGVVWVGGDVVTCIEGTVLRPAE